VTRRVHIHSEASAELLDAIQRVAQDPEAGSPVSVDRNIRRVLVARFPYQVVYRVRPDAVVIVAIAHAKRRPGYWMDRG
jgi:plasmid stabilization system protein ParE